MDIDVVLVKEKLRKNEIGEYVKAGESRRTILARSESITRAELNSAGRFGLNPSMVILTPRINYEGETIAEVLGKPYSIYRTYCNEETDEIELYLKEKAGVRTDEQRED